MDEDKKIRHLEIIQGVITRMSSNSFKLKGWTVTLSAAVFALAAKDSNHTFFLIAFMPIIFFWGLDTYYLKLERQYVNLFEEVRNKDVSAIDFNMKILAIHKDKKTRFWNCLWSPSEFWFYFPCFIIVVIVIYMSNLTNNILYLLKLAIKVFGKG